ncbi:hypothetical protein DFR88_01390 [Metallosphaera sedula]|uniref:Uncharacterized protein n=1 Tax=Metallosphaera prunae TaxID=47304 RepID=A0A4D8RYW3_METPR|nr:hypothetical protein [Metallosphaera prunae]QCO29310.1 hypothetical protein DFR88_01390 [Metallosphaera prunae]
MKKLAIVGVVIILGIIAIVSLFFYFGMGTINTSIPVTTSNSNVTALLNEITTLQNEVNSLTNQNQQLQSNVTALLNEITTLQNEVNSLTNQNQQLQSNVTALLNEITTLQNEVNSLTNQNQQLQSIVNLQDTNTIANDYSVNQPAGQYSTISFTSNYAGYVTVNVLSSTTSKTTVTIVESTNNGQTITSQTYNVGTSGTVVFPVLPGNINIEIGNNNLINGASETVTITYTY